MSMFDGSSGINIHGGNFTAVAGDQITYHNQIFTISGQQLKEKDKWIEEEATAWLSPADYKGTLDLCKGARLTGTCSWVWNRAEFSGWLCQDAERGPELWINGSPGCGKTILASYIIEAVSNYEIPVIYFFCSSQYTGISRGAKRDETLTVIRTLIYQLALLDMSLFEEILQFRDDSKSPGNLNADRLWELFLSFAKKFDLLYCVIDGLDECMDRANENLLHKLMSLKSGSSVRTLIISRNVPDIYEDYKSLGGDLHSILKIASTDVHDDNRSFILAKIQGSSRLRGLPRDLQDEILQKLQSAGDGLILYSMLLLRQLSDTADANDIRSTMANLPIDLQKLYKRIYEQLQNKFKELRLLSPRSAELSRLIFAFAVFGSRPLRLEEFSEASMVEHERRTLNRSKNLGIFQDQLQNIERLASPFIEVARGHIRVIHHSARQFLEEQSKLGSDQIIMDRENAHQLLLQCCLDYLSLSIFREPLRFKKRFESVTKSELTQHHPFLEYAAQHWSSHLQPDFDTPSPKSAPSVISFLNSRSFVTWIQAAIILSCHMDNIAFIMNDIEEWISRAPDGHSEVFKLSKWLQEFRGSIYDWCDAILDHPGEVHFIGDFTPLGSRNIGRKTQKLLRFEEESSRRIFPGAVKDYDYFVRHGSMVAITRKECSVKSDDDDDDPIAIILHDWHMGNCIKVIRFIAPPAPEGSRISFRSIAFSPDGKFIAGSVEPWEPWDTEESIRCTTYVWPVAGTSEKTKWSHTSSPTKSFEWSTSAISFPSSSTILCPSGLFDLETGEPLANLPHDFDDECCSLTFRFDIIGVIRTCDTLEVWRVDPGSRTFDKESSMHVRQELGWSILTNPDTWVIRDISSSGKGVLLTDYTAVVTFDAKKEEFHHYYTLENSSDIRGHFSQDEKKFAILVKGYRGANHHMILCSSTTHPGNNTAAEAENGSLLEPFINVREYNNMKPPDFFRFDTDSNFIHTCSLQTSSKSWLSVFHTVDCGKEWTDAADSQPSERQAFVFGFSANSDILHVSKIPSPSQPLVMDSPVNFRLKSKNNDEEDNYEPAHWSQQKINHQRWSFRDGSMESTDVFAVDPPSHDTVAFFRRYPHAMGGSEALVRFMGNKFDLIDGELPGCNFPVVWDMQPVKENILAYQILFDPPLDEDHFCAHLQQTIISVPQKAVAMIGAFDKADEKEGNLYLPTSYGQPFICIRKLDNTAELLWQWRGEKPGFNSMNLVVSFAFSPDPESGLFAFSTRAGLKDGDGVYIGKCQNPDPYTAPQLISKRCAYQLLFNGTGELLFAITGNCENKNDGTYDTNYFVLSVYEMKSFTAVRRFAGQSPFAYAQTIFLSWQLSENSQDLEQIHVSETMKSQALHAKLCTTSGELSTRVLGSLPTSSNAVEVSQFAVDRSIPDDVRFNVAFRFDNMPPVAISFPDITAGPWQHAPGIILTDHNHNEYQDATMRLVGGIEWSEYQTDEKKLEEMDLELAILLVTENITEGELDTLAPTIAACRDNARKLALEKAEHLQLEIVEAREKLSNRAKRVKEILRNIDC